MRNSSEQNPHVTGREIFGILLLVIMVICRGGISEGAGKK